MTPLLRGLLSRGFMRRDGCGGFAGDWAAARRSGEGGVSEYPPHGKPIKLSAAFRYWFSVGYDFQLLSSSERSAAIESPADWMSMSGDVIIVGMKPSRPLGTCRVAVTLPDGRYTEIYFEHTAGTSTSARP